MIISKEMKKKNISLIDFSYGNSSVVGVLSNKLPFDLVKHIIDFACIRFTTYSNATSDYYRFKINSIISWPKWREKNRLIKTYEVSQSCIKKLKRDARRELQNERLSLIIYGF